MSSNRVVNNSDTKIILTWNKASAKLKIRKGQYIITTKKKKGS